MNWDGLFFCGPKTDVIPLRFLFEGQQWVWNHSLIDHGHFLKGSAANLPYLITPF